MSTSSPRSAISTVTRLLRSFYDDGALRHNPLVARHFDSGETQHVAAERVRTSIRAAIDTIVLSARPQDAVIAKRQRHILLRYDIDCATRETVCSELGITERQMYRDRNAGAGAVARALLEIRLSQEATALCDVSVPGELALQSAFSIMAAGGSPAATDRATAIARETNDVRMRVAAYCVAAQVQYESDEDIDGDRLNLEARGLFESHRDAFGRHERATLASLFQLRSAREAHGRGALLQAVERIRAGVETFLISQGTSNSGPLTQTLLLELMHSAALLNGTGEGGMVETLLRDVRRAIDSAPDMPEYIDLEWRMNYAHINKVYPALSASIESHVNETLARSERLGFPSLATNAAIVSSRLAEGRGDLARARRLLEAAIGFAESVDSVPARAAFHAATAWGESRIGRSARALELAQSARGRLSGDSTLRPFCEFIFSRSLLECGHFEEARDAAYSVASASAPAPHVRGGALLVLAQSSKTLGQHKDAIDFADGAIDVLRGYAGTVVFDEAASIRNLVAIY
jgi:hypothetical protein